MAATAVGGGVFVVLVTIIGWLLAADRRVQSRAETQVDRAQSRAGELIDRAEARANEYATRYQQTQAELDQQLALRRHAEDMAAGSRREVASLRVRLARRDHQLAELRAQLAALEEQQWGKGDRGG